MSFFKEKVRRITNQVRMAPTMRLEENISGLKGELILKAYDTSQGGRMVYSYQQSNIIVNTASILIDRLLKNNTEPQKGISYLAIGSGSGEWDLFYPPAPTTSQTRLENEFYRGAIDLSTFVHPETGEPTTIYTNIVDYSVSFGEGEAVGPIVEMGLFGGDATAELNSGTMVNWRTFPVINKTSTMTLTVIFRITT
jgi:hypothetical protein